MCLQALGYDVESIYVEEFDETFEREEMFKILVSDLMGGAIDVDWRDFFPYLKWIPNKNFEKRIERIYIRTIAVMRTLIQQQKKRFDSGEVMSYLILHV